MSEAHLNRLSWRGSPPPTAALAASSSGNVFLLHWASADRKKTVLGLVFLYGFLLQGNWEAIFPSLPLACGAGRPSRHSSSLW